MKRVTQRELYTKCYLIHDTRDPRGFTIIELIVVMATLLIFGSVAVLVLRSQLLGALETDAEAILSRLQEAQSRAISGVDSKDWGIHFDATSTSPGHFYALFSGSSYATGTEVQKFFLSTFVEFEDPASGSSKDIVFTKLSGVTASTSVTIRLKSNTSEKRTIRANAYGQLAI